MTVSTVTITWNFNRDSTQVIGGDPKTNSLLGA